MSARLIGARLNGNIESMMRSRSAVHERRVPDGNLLDATFSQLVALAAKVREIVEPSGMHVITEWTDWRGKMELRLHEAGFTDADIEKPLPGAGGVETLRKR